MDRSCRLCAFFSRGRPCRADLRFAPVLFAAVNRSGNHPGHFARGGISKRDQPQNRRLDDRCRGKADFIYTDSDFGCDLAVGVNYSITKHCYIGAVADFTTVYIGNGWDRYSSFVPQSGRQYLVPAGGIKFGYRGTKNSSIEATVLLGRNGVGYFLGTVWDF
jgi:hypothetical protein